MKISVLFLAVVMSSFLLKGMGQHEGVDDSANSETEQSPLLNLPQEMIEQILVKQLESCTSFDEQLKEIYCLRPVNRYFNKLFADFDSYFMKLVLGALERNLTQEDKNKRLYNAALNGQVLLVNSLIKLGADGNAKDYMSCTALHRAAKNGHTQIAELLVKVADINTRDNYGLTALDRVACNGHLEIAKLLITNGAEVNAKDYMSCTALHRAAFNGHTQIAELLVKVADINTRDDYGWTALHYAACNGHTQLAKLLIAHGANVNEKNICDETALHCVARNGHPEVAKMLLEHGAVDQENKNGITALLCAKAKGYTQIASLISAAISAASVSHSHSALTNLIAPKAEAID